YRIVVCRALKPKKRQGHSDPLNVATPSAPKKNSLCCIQMVLWYVIWNRLTRFMPVCSCARLCVCERWYVMSLQRIPVCPVKSLVKEHLLCKADTGHERLAAIGGVRLARRGRVYTRVNLVSDSTGQDHTSALYRASTGRRTRRRPASAQRYA